MAVAGALVVSVVIACFAGILGAHGSAPDASIEVGFGHGFPPADHTDVDGLKALLSAQMKAVEESASSPLPPVEQCVRHCVHQAQDHWRMCEHLEDGLKTLAGAGGSDGSSGVHAEAAERALKICSQGQAHTEESCRSVCAKGVGVMPRAQEL
eukprot:TRINITY_DN53326_c0_g1_i1.p1 TRINITY_DN53326_c0_g1~~TRINITY_DN53326_c0_g1_i1.p1  ORF type:complete len:171 (+),score=36.21 TRINITY_DN53326_c0_g1_i1:56-514(+)